MTAFLHTFTVIVLSLAMALAVAHALEMPGKMRLSREDYFTVQRIYYPGFTIGGISEPGRSALGTRARTSHAGCKHRVLADPCGVCSTCRHAGRLLGRRPSGKQRVVGQRASWHVRRGLFSAWDRETWERGRRVDVAARPVGIRSFVPCRSRLVQLFRRARHEALGRSDCRSTFSKRRSPSSMSAVRIAPYPNTIPACDASPTENHASV